MSAVASMALVLSALGVLFYVVRSLRSRGIMSGEYARKAAHVGMGLVCLSFPWLFSSAWPVLTLAAVAAAGLLALRFEPRLRALFGCVLHDVERKSYGEFAFIGGITCAFVFALGHPLAYVIPVVVLALADTVAALVGSRFGAHRFVIQEGSKSLEGSAAFLFCAFTCVAAPLIATGQPHALLSAGITAIALMVVEACSNAGLDNFTIPLAGGMLVQSFFHG